MAGIKNIYTTLRSRTTKAVSGVLEYRTRALALVRSPGTRRHGNGGPFEQIEAPVFLHVVAQLQVARHRDGRPVGRHRRCARHQERIERGIGLDQLALHMSKKELAIKSLQMFYQCRGNKSNRNMFELSIYSTSLPP